MSGPIRPPLRVRDTDSAPNVIPVNTIVVSDGDLVDDGGATVTIDTTGASTTPGGSDTEIQYNNAGAFGGDAGLIVSNEGGGDTTSIQVGTVKYGASLGAQQMTVDGSLSLFAEGTGQIFLRNSEDGGGTWTDTITNVMANAAADNAILRLRNNSGTYKEANITLDANEDLIIDNDYTANNDIDLQVGGTGIVEVQNTTTDTDAVLSIMGNGTGDAKLDLQNASKRVWALCDENKKLKIQGGAAGNTFIFDVSSASGGITFPDSTTQTTAAGGVAATSGAALTDPTVIATGYNRTPTSQRIGGGVLGLAAGELAYSDPFGFPWVSPHTGTIADITVSVSTAQASRTLEGGIYESDSDGWPSTLLASFDIALDSTGEITQTSFTGTPAVTKGSVYWFIHIADGATSTTARVYARENNITYGGFQPIMGVHSTGAFGNSIPTGAIIDGETSLPATVTTSAIQTTNKDLLQYLVGW